MLWAKLLEFERYQLQKSVYVSKYACEEEIEELGRLLNISNNINVIIATSLGINSVEVVKCFRDNTVRHNIGK